MGYSNPADLASINPRQLSVTKIYPGNYSNVLRYWHEVSSFSFQDPNGIDRTYENQPIGGPVGVVFKPGVIAQQAIGYVDLSFQDLGSLNQMSYYMKPYGSGNAGGYPTFKEADVIIPSPDFHKDVRPDLTQEILVPSGAWPYRASLRLSGGDVVNTNVAGAAGAPALALGTANTGLTPNVTASGGFAAVIVGSGTRIINGETAQATMFDNSTVYEVTDVAGEQWKLYSVYDQGGGGSGILPGSGTYDPRAGANFLAGDLKALGICEVCWLVPDQPPERDDLTLQPDGLVESQVYTSTVPRARR